MLVTNPKGQKTKMPNFSPPFISLLTILFLSFLILQSVPIHKVSLIHRDSPLSPFYNSNISLVDYWSSILDRSDFRHDFIQSIFTNHSTSQKTARMSKLGSHWKLINPYMFGEYLMKFTVGTPAVEFLGVVDLNGDFVHTKCKGCTDCGPIGGRSYDFEKSSTYANVPCASVTCGNQDRHDCAGWDRCEYTRTGPDMKDTIGILTSDVLCVATYVGGQASFDNFAFGCCIEHCPVHNKVSAWIGVAGGLFALVNQMAYDIKWRFSHCLTSDPIGSSHLQFGHEAVLSGFPARMEYCKTGKFSGYISTRIADLRVNHRYYYAGAISFGSNEPCHVVFDTLSPMTYLPRGPVNHLTRYLPQEVKLPVVNRRGWELCFAGTWRDLSGLPEIGIAFYGAGIKNGPPGMLDIDFPVANTYGMVDDNTICLLIKPTDGINSIIGTRLLHNVVVGYDFINRTIYMDRIPCDGL